MTYDPSRKIRDYQVFGEFGGVNPSIADACTFTFMDTDSMENTFHGLEDRYLYSRHWNPTNKTLSNALAEMEDTESAQVTGSGMSAIVCTILQICKMGDEMIAHRITYGGTYALFKNVLPKFGITVHFVDATDLESVKQAVTDKTKLIYTETMSNPLIEVIDIEGLSKIAHSNDMKLVVDNTFCPMVVSPARLGADVVVYSLTKFVNGNSDGVGGCICSTKKFINQLIDLNDGNCMLFGPVMDSFRAANIYKNLHTLHVRMAKHSENAMFLAKEFEKIGIKTFYPGLESHPHHELLKVIRNDGFGFGGMLAVETGSKEKSKQLMVEMQNEKVGYLAVSLGYVKTLFSMPGSSTSSEIPEKEQKEMGLTDSIVRMSVGLDHNIQTTWDRIKTALRRVNMI
jgi:methionine-gamma-lyase